MKTIPKNLLDAAIDGVRGYYDGTVSLDDMVQREEALAKVSNGNYTRWADLIRAIVPAYGGLKPDATNEDIYAVLNVLGYEVV